MKRTHLDEKCVRAAQGQGAELKELFEVGRDVAFDKDTGLWTVKSTKVCTTGRLLAAALDTRLGTQGCSRTTLEPLSVAANL